MRIAGMLAIAVLSPFFASSAAAVDIKRGEQRYYTCRACHGVNGEGNELLNSPPLAGMPAWYTARQLKNFKEGIRGDHPDDTYGREMAPMARMLPTDDDIANVSAYLEQLGK